MSDKILTSCCSVVPLAANYTFGDLGLKNNGLIIYCPKCGRQFCGNGYEKISSDPKREKRDLYTIITTNT